MDYLREAFSKIKRDIEFLNNEVSSLRKELVQTREELIKICEIMMNLDRKASKTSKRHERQERPLPAHQHIIQTLPTYSPTHNLPLNTLKDQNNVFSNGNEGVPTDRQTDRQTDTSEGKMPFLRVENTPIFNKNREKTPDFSYFSEQNENLLENPIDNAAKILDSLDSIKKEIRLKFKRLTNQEMLVFSTLYQIEEESGQADYKILAKRLGLTESSIRDYIGKLIKKGIPVEKKRINNKTILLSISANLKKITSLSTILQLRGI